MTSFIYRYALKVSVVYSGAKRNSETLTGRKLKEIKGPVA